MNAERSCCGCLVVAVLIVMSGCGKDRSTTADSSPTDTSTTPPANEIAEAAQVSWTGTTPSGQAGRSLVVMPRGGAGELALLVGASAVFSKAPGYVHVAPIPAANDTPPSWEFESRVGFFDSYHENSSFGESVAVSYVDGLADRVVIGAAGRGCEDGESFLVPVASLAPGDLDVQRIADGIVQGDACTAQSGASVFFHDADGDGQQELGVASVHPGDDRPGEVAFLPGDLSGSMVTDQAEITLVGAQNGDILGMDAVGGRDLNGDGFEDLVVGASRHGGGRAYIVYGPLPAGTHAIESVAGATLQAELDDTGLGLWLHIASDVTGDGLPDVLVGSHIHTEPGGEFRAGRLYVLPGGSEGVIAASEVETTVSGGRAWGFLGVAAVDADLNGDGQRDLIVGEPSYLAGEPGRIHVYMGPFGGHLQASDADVTLGGSLGGAEGWSLAVVPGEGGDRLVVGEPSVDAEEGDEGRVYLLRPFASW